MGSRGAIASGTHFVAIGASVRDISFLRQIAPKVERLCKLGVL